LDESYVMQQKPLLLAQLSVGVFVDDSGVYVPPIPTHVSLSKFIMHLEKI